MSSDWDEERLVDGKFGDTVCCCKKLRGTYLDVISLLSNNGKTNYLVKSDGSFVGLDIVNGKHLVICCVSLPFTDDYDDSEAFWRAIVGNYSSLKNKYGFEMVVAVTIKNNQEFVFDNFLSSLPCLAIPFPDLDTRTSICSFMGFPLRHYSHSEVSAIVVNPTGIILHYLDTPTLFLNYGFEWFTSNATQIAHQDDILRFRFDPFHKKLKGYDWPETREPLSLDKDILLCDPSLMLYTLSGQSMTVSQLSKKYVVLYLCINFTCRNELKYIHDKCIQNKQELEIVLVYLPIFQNPKLYDEQLEIRPVNSWFIFPFDDHVSRRLWRVFAMEEIVDRFIIVPPKGNSGGELVGRNVVQHFSNRLSIHAYPFTRTAFLEKWLAALKSVTAASLFKGSCETDTCLVQHDNVVVPQSVIKGKNLVLYAFRTQQSNLYRQLIKNYPEIQAMGCEVVCIPLYITGVKICRSSIG